MNVVQFYLFSSKGFKKPVGFNKDLFPYIGNTPQGLNKPRYDQLRLISACNSVNVSVVNNKSFFGKPSVHNISNNVGKAESGVFSKLTSAKNRTSFRIVGMSKTKNVPVAPIEEIARRIKPSVILQALNNIGYQRLGCHDLLVAVYVPR